MFFIFLNLIMSLVHASSGPEAIYGIDNRVDVIDSRDPILKMISRSTVSMIPKENIVLGTIDSSIKGPLYKDLYNLCPSEKFRYQLTASSCSGTLIDKDTILTAGHCLSHGNLECNGNYWVFDFHASSSRQETLRVPTTSVYKCKKIIAMKNLHTPNEMIDYALVKLDRAVEDRVPVKIRTTGTILPSDSVVLIGNPRGLPTKIADGGKVKEVFKTYFTSNVDAFSNNSGSGVFNQHTGELEGILVSGLHDFETNSNGCTKSSVFDENNGSEMVTKVDVIWKILNKN